MKSTHYLQEGWPCLPSAVTRATDAADDGFRLSECLHTVSMCKRLAEPFRRSFRLPLPDVRCFLRVRDPTSTRPSIPGKLSVESIF